MGMLSDGLAHLALVRETEDGEQVTYRRRGKADLTITAVPERTVPQTLAIADGRAELTVEPQDWLVRPVWIDFGAGPVPPQDGDRIIDADGVIYEVRPRDGEPGKRKDQKAVSMYRIRTVVES